MLSGAFILNKQFPPSLLLCCGEVHILINNFIDDLTELPYCIFSEIKESETVLSGAFIFNKQFPPSLLLCCGEAHILN